MHINQFESVVTLCFNLLELTKEMGLQQLYTTSLVSIVTMIPHSRALSEVRRMFKWSEANHILPLSFNRKR